jgi:hypothetical protein
MVTNSTYKSYSNQIAKHFCKDDPNKILCEAAIINRLNSFLDDYTYPYFLAKLNQGRQYITELQNFQNKGFRIVITDLISGEQVSAWWDIPYNYPYLGQLPGKLLSHNFNIISANKTFNEANKSDVRITWNPTKPTYGITFVPQQVPGYNPPSGGGSTYVPPGSGGGGVVITPDPVQQVSPSGNEGFDVGELLKNPIVLIGGAVVLYFILKEVL